MNSARICGYAVLLLAVLAAKAAAVPASRAHVVTSILRDGRSVPSSPVTLTYRSGRVEHSIATGARIDDGTRIVVPARTKIVFVSTGAKSTTTLSPDTSFTFLVTGTGESSSLERGNALFSVVHGALDFFEVTHTQRFTAAVRGTDFRVTAGGSGITFSVDRGSVDVTRVGKIVVASKTVDAIMNVDVLSAAGRRQIAFTNFSDLLATFSTFEQAGKFFENQLDAARKNGDGSRVRAALMNIGIVAWNLGRCTDALQSQREALQLFRRRGDVEGQASALSNVGIVQAGLGRDADALQSQREALALFRQIADRDGEANTLTNLGFVEGELGRYADAMRSHQHALALFRELKDLGGQARVLTNVGAVERARAQYGAALRRYGSALALYRKIGDRDGEADVLEAVGATDLLLHGGGIAPAEWVPVKSIPVGKNPLRAVLTPDGREAYVTNTDDNSVSVIDVQSERVTATLNVGGHPGSIVVSPDGHHVYVANNDGDVSVIDVATKRVESISTKTNLSGVPVANRNHVRDLALAPDGRRLYLAMEWEGLQVVDLPTRSMSQLSPVMCPEGLAMRADGKRLYVSYQCGGPGGSLGHDSIGMLDLEPNQPCSPERGIPLQCTIRGFPNVGGQIALSPDGSQVWINGNDACSQPVYSDRMGEPRRVFSVFATSTNSLLKALTFSVEEGNGGVSFAPSGGAVMIGGGTVLKIFDWHRLKSRQTLRIADGGVSAFTTDGLGAFVPVAGKNVVVVLRTRSPAGTQTKRARVVRTPVVIGRADRI